MATVHKCWHKICCNFSEQCKFTMCLVKNCDLILSRLYFLIIFWWDSSHNNILSHLNHFCESTRCNEWVYSLVKKSILHREWERNWMKSMWNAFISLSVHFSMTQLVWTTYFIAESELRSRFDGLSNEFKIELSLGRLKI